MPLEEVKGRWGADHFDVEKFKNGSPQDRAKMAYDLISSRKFVGSTLKDVEDTLGRHDAYYLTDTFPAYFIGPSPVKGRDVWQIVFLFSEDHHIKEVVVNKNNCCD